MVSLNHFLSGLRDPTTQREQQIRSVLTSLGLPVFGIALTFVASIPALALLIGLGGNPQDPALQLGLSTILQAAGFGAAVVGYMRLSGKQDLLPYGLPTRAGLKWIGTGIGALLLLNIISMYLLAFFDLSTGTNTAVEIGTNNPRVLLYLVPLSFIAIGPGEELMFRGAVQGRLDQVFSTRVAVILASIIFASIHYGSILGTSIGIVAYIATVFLLSLVLGYAYAKTENILIPSVIHGAYNAILFFGLYLQTTGLLSPPL